MSRCTLQGTPQNWPHLEGCQAYALRRLQQMLWLISVLLGNAHDRRPEEAASSGPAEQAHRASAKKGGGCLGLGWLRWGAASRTPECLLISHASRWIARVLRVGDVPRHIGFILDGNRRFAVKNNMEKRQGHAWGFDKLHEALEWCFDAGVGTVSVYAFSIENFKRPKDEVDTLMRLAQEKFEYLLTKSDLMKKNQVVIRVLGDLDLLSADLRRVVDRVMDETAHNVGPTLNVCFPYTATHELVDTTRRIAQSCVQGQACNLSVADFERAMFTRGDHPQLLVRTSGETRLSDFFCWQTGDSVFMVYECLWPEFSITHFAWAVVYYRFVKAVYGP